MPVPLSSALQEKMAFSKTLIASMLLSLLVLQLVQALESEKNPNQSSSAGTTPAVGSGTSGKMDCGAACVARCGTSKRPNLCQRACGTCCTRCNCVPPGTSGNYDACPCYANLTTHGNQHKCP